jgi:nucleoside-diphosphate-sugar epimerase
MAVNHALVTGAHGIVGLNLVEELAGRVGWRVTASGRRATFPFEGVEYIPADLTSSAATRAAFQDQAAVTHLFFAAFRYNSDSYEEIAVNVAILQNTLDALRAAGARLQRVLIYQGGKAYGALLGPVRTPAKESDPRVPGPLFYYDQEDLLYARGAKEGFAVTVLRPDYIQGFGLGSYANLINTVAVYGTICKAVGIPMYFPGGPQAFESLLQLTDARLLARGSIWAALADDRQNALYNITNGDLFRWSNVWPRLADYFGVAPGHPMHIDLKLFMRDKGPLWAELKRKYGLSVNLDEIQNWDQAYIMNARSDMHSSTIRIRKAGFHECLDSDDRFFELFDEMRARKYIP